MKVVLAGGSGALGRRLALRLARDGFEVVVLSRRERSIDGARTVLWSGTELGRFVDELDGAHVVNLCGEIVDRRPTRRNIELLTSSRVAPTSTLAEASQRVEVRTFVQLSTLAIFGDAGDIVLTEDSPPAAGPPQQAGVALAWERAADSIRAQCLTILRPSIVLDPAAPVMARLAGLARWGLGGTVGSGRQWVSWLHFEDFERIVARCLDGSLPGVVLASSPNPVQGKEFMRELRHALHRRLGLPTPTALVRLGAPLLGTDAALALTGRRAHPARLLDAGFQFDHPDLRTALADLLAESR